MLNWFQWLGLACLAIFLLPLQAAASPLEIIRTPEQFQQSLQTSGQKQMLNLQQLRPQPRLELIFAGKQHFLKRALYPEAVAYLRQPVAQALQQVEAELNHQGLGLKVWDAYRPYHVSQQMWQLLPDARYVANPAYGSKHNRGCAVDLTLVELKSGKELEMPSAYLDFSQKAWHSYSQLSPRQRYHRALLKNSMQKHGFEAYAQEWWHYNFKGWQNFELLDLSFDQLKALQVAAP